MDNNKFAFRRINFILLAISVVIVIAGFILMSGPGSTDTEFNPDIFSDRRIKLAPVVCLVGFLMMIVAIMYKPRNKENNLVKEDNK